MKKEILVLMTAICSFFIGCGSKNEESSEISGTSKTVIGFYAFDGTGENLRNNGSVVGELWEDIRGVKYYFPGVNLNASNAESRAQDAVEVICGHRETRGVNTIFMTGYSRGSIIAIEVAHRIKEQCGDGLNLRWMGIIDAVDFNIGHFSSNVPDGMAAVHIRKERQGFEPHTKQITGNPMANLTLKVDHVHIGYERQSYTFLKNHAQKMGAKNWIR
jgi:hypothetical protein